MAYLYVQETLWTGLEPAQDVLIRHVGEVALGQPGRCLDEGETPWLVWDDGRFLPVDMARLGCVLANLDEYPGAVSDDPLADNEAFCATHGLVWPVAGLDNADNPFQAAYDAQAGAPAGVRIELGPLWPVVAE